MADLRTHNYIVTSNQVVPMDRLYNAVIALEAARSTLTTYGEDGAAAALRGLEVYSIESAEVALDAVRHAPVRTLEGRMALVDAAYALEFAASRHSTKMRAVA